MSPCGLVCVSLLALHWWRCAAAQCSWTGSGLARGDYRTVLQVRLRCTEGSVEWVYPGQALRVALEPNLSYAARATVCIQPFRTFRGVSVYVQRAAGLELLRTDGGRPQQVFCFWADGPQRPVIYLHASPRADNGGRTVGFRYELLPDRSASPSLGGGVLQASCRPCDDAQLLMAVCNSDFVIRGSIATVSHDPERQTSVVEVSGARVYRQRGGVFQQEAGAPGPSGPDPPRLGRVHTLLRCRVKPGGGDFLFTGREHFGEAWLGCAPRYEDFLFLYRTARAARLNPCDFPLD
ncbi:meteorin-like protein [Lampris incognitus]|uniref:meteorin-like protein n=1 Tax=Lampris incognitus TaxID=2546036 RepID=UPI0024B4EA0A|nr:meteorin-like protein [Lampris incognitus]